MITAILITLIVVKGLDVLVTIGQIGKPKKPTTPGVAVVAVVLIALQIWGLGYVLVGR